MIDLIKKFFKKGNKISKGDIVVCIDDREWNNGKHTIDLSYNKKYKVLDINKSCHNISFDIGSRFYIKTTRTSCINCGKDLIGQGIHWAGDFRFRKATPEEETEYYTEIKSELELEEELNIAVKQEQYEKASEIKKQLEKVC